MTDSQLRLPGLEELAAEEDGMGPEDAQRVSETAREAFETLLADPTRTTVGALREEFERLDELIDISMEYFPQIFPDAVYNKSSHIWEFGSGERLLFRYAKREVDYWKFHGKGYPFIGFDELTSWPDDKLYIKMMSICRSSFPGMPRHYRATCNPYGVGHNWVKMRFIDPSFLRRVSNSSTFRQVICRPS